MRPTRLNQSTVTNYTDDHLADVLRAMLQADDPAAALVDAFPPDDLERAAIKLLAFMEVHVFFTLEYLSACLHALVLKLECGPVGDPLNVGLNAGQAVALFRVIREQIGRPRCQSNELRAGGQQLCRGCPHRFTIMDVLEAKIYPKLAKASDVFGADAFAQVGQQILTRAENFVESKYQQYPRGKLPSVFDQLATMKGRMPTFIDKHRLTYSVALHAEIVGLCRKHYGVEVSPDDAPPPPPAAPNRPLRLHYLKALLAVPDGITGGARDTWACGMLSANGVLTDPDICPDKLRRVHSAYMSGRRQDDRFATADINMVINELRAEGITPRAELLDAVKRKAM